MAARKRSQYLVKVWFPDGARLEQYSHRQLSEFEWKASLREVIETLQRIVDPPTTVTTTSEPVAAPGGPPR